MAVLLSGCQPPPAASGGSTPSTVASTVTSVSSNTTVVEDIDDREPMDSTVPAEVEAASVEEAPPLRQRPLRKLDPDELEIITFDDLKINMEADTVFNDSMLTDRVKQLNGQRVRIRGFLFPAIFQQTGIDKFPLVMNTQCKFGPGGQAHHIVMVELVDGVTTSYTVRPIAVEGRLTLKPWSGPDGNTWSLYHMVGDKVE